MTRDSQSMPPLLYCSVMARSSLSTASPVCVSRMALMLPAIVPIRNTAKTVKTARKMPVSLKAVVRNSRNLRGLGIVPHHVTGAAHRVQQRPVKALVDFGAEPRHVHVD